MAKSKKELDKDMMFQKIMPALSENPFSGGNALANINSKSMGSASVLESRLFARREDYETGVGAATVNAMEEYVLRHADSVIQRFKLCRCDRCRRDVAAHALNNLPPKYVEATADEIAKAIDEVPQSTVLDVLVKAALYVRSNPNH